MAIYPLFRYKRGLQYRSLSLLVSFYGREVVVAKGKCFPDILLFFISQLCFIIFNKRYIKLGGNSKAHVHQSKFEHFI